MSGPLPPVVAGPLRAVLVGLGETGGAWLSALTGPAADAMGLALVAVCDVDVDRALAALARAGRTLPVAADLAQALGLAPDLVVDCGSANVRPATARAVLRAGAALLCEPPLARDEEAATALVGASARATRFLAVSRPLRLEPGLRQLKALVDDGGLGRAHRLEAVLRLPGATPDALRDAAPDLFDAARMVLGRDAVSVACAEEGPPSPRLRARFQMDDGSRFDLDASASAPAGPHGAWHLTLERGEARWDGGAAARAWSLDDGRRPHGLTPVAGRTGREGVLLAAVAALRLGVGPETRARAQAGSLAMTLAAWSSLASGRPAPVRPLGLASDASAWSRTTGGDRAGGDRAGGDRDTATFTGARRWT